MTAADIIRLEDHRKSARPAVSPDRESPAPIQPDARRAPDPAAAFAYPPARPIVDWMPGPDPVEGQVDAAFRWLAFLALAGAGAIMAGAVLTTVAGAFAAIAVGGA